MKDDALEILLRDTLRDDVAAARENLDGMEKRILLRLGDRHPHVRWSAWWRQMLAPSRSARWAQLAVVTATAAVFLLVGVSLSERTLSPESVPTLSLQSDRCSDGTHEVLFVLPALDAGSVNVVGNFNNWEGTPLSDPNGDGIWTARVNLTPGRYEYAFIIDGRWWGQDPLADEYIRSFGEYSSVRYVGRGGDDA